MFVRFFITENKNQGEARSPANILMESFATIANEFQRLLVGVLATHQSMQFAKINAFLVIENYILVSLIQITFNQKTPVINRKFKATVCYPLRKISSYYIIFWGGNIAERHKTSTPENQENYGILRRDLMEDSFGEKSRFHYEMPTFITKG